ncbi:MAG: hypothetical protein ACTSV1_03020 [Alphaproteobacteria bacterium]
MNRYLENFIQHSGQIDSFLAAAAVWIGFAAIGTLFVGRDKIIEAAPLYGWAAINFGLTAVGVLKIIPFSTLGIAAGLAAIAAGVVAWRRGQAIFPAGTLRLMLLAAPLLVLVSAMVGSQWDEFSDWLMTPRQLMTSGAFPTTDTVHLSGRLAAYPFGWHYVTFLTSLLAGRLVENAGALINVFMLLTFGLLSVRLIRSGLGRPDDTSTPSWSLVALCGLLATLLNTTFAQKVALTSYADVATAAVAAMAGVIGWTMLDAFAGKRRQDALRHALQIGLLLMLLVNLKQSTVALAAIVAGAVILAGLRDPKIKFRDLLAAVPHMVVPGIVIFAIWRYYVSSELTTGEMTVRPASQWLIAEIPQIIWNMLVVLSKKGAYLALMVTATGFAIAALIRKVRTPFDRLAVIVGSIFLVHNAFLLFVYISTFGKFDALRVASLWRYNMQLGLLGVAFTAYGLAVAWRTYGADKFELRKIAWLPIVLMLAAPFVFADKLRFDNDGALPHYRTVGAALNSLLVSGDTLTVLDPDGSGESGEITRFEMGGGAIYKGYLAYYHKPTLEIWRNHLINNAYSHVLTHSTSPSLEQALGVTLEKARSYLLRSDGAGGWRIIHQWKRPAP